MPSFHKLFGKKPRWAILVIAALCTVAGTALAALDNISGPPTKSKDFAGILTGIAKFVTTFGTPVAAFFIVLTGFMFVAARGNAKKLEDARTMLWWVVVGTAIIVGAGPIATMVIDFAKEL
jgi:hypothetical protein